MALSYVFTESERNTIITITIVTACFSLIGELFIFSVFSKYKQLRVFPFRYVFFLSTADFVNSIGFLLVNDNLNNQEEANFLCKLQGFLINYGELSSICWTTVIAWLLYQQIMIQRIENIQKLELRFFMYAYILPLFMSFIPVLTADYGKAGGWCWIKMDQDNKWKSAILRLIQFYLPLWIAFFYNGITIYKVVNFVKQKNLDDKDKKLVYKLKYYPLILFVCWTFGTIDRITNYFGLESFGLHVVNILFSGLQGFLNSLIYGLSQKVRALLKESCPCTQQQQDSDEQNLKQQENNKKQQPIQNQEIELQIQNQMQQQQNTE